jgi:hypothetical protein
VFEITFAISSGNTVTCETTTASSAIVFSLS